MTRMRKPPSSSANLKPTLCDIFGDSVSKHRSCWLHIVGNHYRSKKNITWEEVEEIKKQYRHTAPCFSRNLPHRVRLSHKRSTNKVSNGMNNNVVTTRSEGDKLDTDQFECYMESLWKNVSEDKRMSFAYLDSLWFSLYREPSTKPKVLTWIKQKHIFSKKYVFVPIVCWDHWSLVVLVHLGESPYSETRTPCILLLDSLQNAEPKRLEPEIRKFVADIYKSEGRIENKKEIAQIPLLVPKVPQQRDNEKCGSYVLYFIKLFMENAPENFSITNGYPYFMKADWFEPEDLESFRKKLEKELPRKKSDIKYTRSSRHKLRQKGRFAESEED
ncbi:hypothetical protein RND81_12G140400 [Saponaria officinalis]|uniref:Ubiquitin-like protease family profile domain-containing protein n=1 Tax=Saponaria officinalis TaxID=3572 RepID=A0AAW1HAJ2_SAPOF